MRVGLYFGSFNPVHGGHMRIAFRILRQGLVDNVWFVITPNNPFKNPLSVAPDWLRFQLIHRAITHYSDKEYDKETRELASKMKPSLLECDLPRPTYTYLSLREFKKKYPQHEFSVIMGEDNLCRFDQWKEYKEIEDNYPIICYKRLGPDTKVLKKKYPTVQFVDGDYIDISATDIRVAIQRNECDAEHHWEWFRDAPWNPWVYPDTVESYEAWFREAHKYLDQILTLGYQDEKFHTWVDSRYRIDKVDEEGLKDLTANDYELARERQ